ncbi:MAG: LicD family protein [Lachnospiraceae bacterium]|nr:LicD family protein [Lachnospiraceae bacterium]
MLHFEDGFFDEEIKCDFRISAAMKCAWAAQLEVLDRVDRICRKHGIRYFAFWGTLLGAVRHQGFIPWDDDIDICMTRENYMDFLTVAGEELPEEYAVLNIYREEQYENSFTRVTNGREINFSKEHLREYHGCPFIVGIDIFPLDYLSCDEEKLAYQQKIMGIIKNMISLAKFVEKNENDPEKTLIVEESRSSLKEGIRALEEALDWNTDPGRTDLNRLRQLFDMACMMSNETEADYVTSMPEYTDGQPLRIPKSCFGEAEMVFEGCMIKVPEDYDTVLRILFGDYMVPVRTGSGHDYPFYKDQLEILHSRGIWLDKSE